MTAKITEKTPATEGQNKQAKRLFEDTGNYLTREYPKLELNFDEAQTLLGKGDELQAGMLELVKKLSITNQYAKEEVASKYGYLSGYEKPKPIGEQIAKLKELFPGLGEANTELVAQINAGTAILPEKAEGWVAIPNLKKLPNLFGNTYGQAVQKVLDLIKKARNGKFQNYREGKLGEQYLRQTSALVTMLSKVAEAQGNPDILIIPAQFGFLHRGRSVRRAREVMRGGEFGLGAFNIGCMLLTHPERLKHYDDLWIDCAGDEYSDSGGGVFECAPYFEFSDGGVEFDAIGVSFAVGFYGSASGVFPQS
jgi:hypothetical protein